MIRLEKTDGDVATLEGAPVEVLAFYCAWQTSLWPDWMLHGKLGIRGDTATEQHMRVLRLIAAGDVVSLSMRGAEFQKALEFAEDFCSKLGITVEVREASQT